MEFLKKWYTELAPETVVEFQPDTGGLAQFLRPSHPGYWYGVETWAPNVVNHSHWSLYDKVIVADIRHLDFESIYTIPDLVVLDDVLPHMDREEAVVILNKVKVWTDAMVLSVPLGVAPHHEAGNWTYGHQWNPTPDDVESLLGRGVIKKVAFNSVLTFFWRADG